jgi:hypothetical protein
MAEITMRAKAIYVCHREAEAELSVEIEPGTVIAEEGCLGDLDEALARDIRDKYLDDEPNSDSAFELDSDTDFLDWEYEIID